MEKFGFVKVLDEKKIIDQRNDHNSRSSQIRTKIHAGKPEGHQAAVRHLKCVQIHKKEIDRSQQKSSKQTVGSKLSATIFGGVQPHVMEMRNF